MIRLVFMGIISSFLLALYVYAIVYAIDLSCKLNQKHIVNTVAPNREQKPVPKFNSQDTSKVEPLKATNSRLAQASNCESAVTPQPKSSNDLELQLPEGLKNALSLVGGLVSALVISVLAITPPNESPAKTLLANFTPVGVAPEIPISALTENITKILTYTYLAVWLLSGIAAVAYVFTRNFPHEVPELTAVAKSWFGIAVAAAYAFFGLKQ